ncbi:MAG: glutamyl-Q tRNA(Asp) ligase [Coxiella sp. DG_40]|nr:MAG: glutamyl-Q tRNA(Asp) ligase [Coxiella sp. DG_40]
MQVRTRFAPSPTGYLHVGSIRTALYSWLYARKHGGKFFLRIEDTDVERSTKEAIQVILDSIQWLNLEYDETVFYQSQHMDRYKQVIQRLLNEGKAYRCYCSKQRLDDLREKQLAKKQKPCYDGLCRERDLDNPDQPHVIRFKNPRQGTVSFEDQVHGVITFQNSELDDLIIMRSDGTPTYNLCVVIDDMDMDITHVIRGVDHINNTPRQINILKALGAKIPIYAHVPMILGEDGKKLSKRHGAASVTQYREEGFLPEALLNYLVRLGWAYGDQEIFTLDEMIKLFELKDINKASSAFNREKLLWLNQYYMKTKDPELVAKHLQYQMDKLNIDITQDPKLSQVVTVQAERCHTLQEMAEKSRYFYQDITSYEDKAGKFLTSEIVPTLNEIKEKFQNLENWSAERIHQIIIGTAEKFVLKLGKVAQPIRVAVTGGTISPPIDITLQLIGKQRVIERLDKALKAIVS